MLVIVCVVASKPSSFLYFYLFTWRRCFRFFWYCNNSQTFSTIIAFTNRSSQIGAITRRCIMICTGDPWVQRASSLFWSKVNNLSIKSFAKRKLGPRAWRVFVVRLNLLYTYLWLQIIVTKTKYLHISVPFIIVFKKTRLHISTSKLKLLALNRCLFLGNCWVRHLL